MKDKNKLDLIKPYINKNINNFTVEFIKQSDEIIGVCLINWDDMVVYICIGDKPDFIVFNKDIHYISYQYTLYNMDEFLKIWDGVKPANVIVSEKNNLMFFLTDYLKQLGYNIISSNEIPGGIDRGYLLRNIGDDQLKKYENMVIVLLKTFNIRVLYYSGEIQYLPRPTMKPYEKPMKTTDLYYISGHATRYYSDIEDINKKRITLPNNMSCFIFTETGVPLDDEMMFFINYGIKPYLDELKELAFSDSPKLDELEFKIYCHGLINIKNYSLTSLKFDFNTFSKMRGNRIDTKDFLNCPVIDMVKYIAFTLCGIKESELPLSESDAIIKLKHIVEFWNINSTTQLYEPLIRFLTKQTDELSQNILKMNYFTWWKKLKGLTLRRYHMKSIPDFKISFSGDNKIGSPMGVINGPFPDEWIEERIETSKNIVDVPGEKFGRDIYLHNIIDTFKLLKTYSPDNMYIFILFICNTIELNRQTINTVHSNTDNLNKIINEEEPIKRLRSMSISYKDKYLKYKNKYLSLKEKL